MSSVRSHRGFTSLASKQLAREWEPFKRQVDEEILIQLWVFPHGGVIFTTSLQSLFLTLARRANLLCLVSHKRQFSESCCREKGKRRREERSRAVPTGSEEKKIRV